MKVSSAICSGVAWYPHWRSLLAVDDRVASFSPTHPLARVGIHRPTGGFAMAAPRQVEGTLWPDLPFGLDAVPFDVITQVGVRKADVLADLVPSSSRRAQSSCTCLSVTPSRSAAPRRTVEPLGRWVATAPAR